MFILERLVGVIAPFSCLKCGQEGAVVCKRCLGSFCVPLPERCYRCLRPSPDFTVCAMCQTKSPLGHVWIASKLDGLPEKLVHTFKFERAQAVAPTIAQLMQCALPAIRPDMLVVPVPTATSRVRQRGYDHTALLARTLAHGYKHQSISALKRLGHSRQVGATRVQRMAQLTGAFRTVKPVTGKHLLLVDDVVTTGATLEEAARVLRSAGAERTDALVFAQK